VSGVQQKKQISDLRGFSHRGGTVDGSKKKKD